MNIAPKVFFWVPPEARWSYLQKQAKQRTIGQLIDDAMIAGRKRAVCVKWWSIQRNKRRWNAKLRQNRPRGVGGKNSLALAGAEVRSVGIIGALES